MSSPATSSRPHWHRRWLTAVGVIGTALTLFAGLEGLLQALDLVADWVRLIVDGWRSATRAVWSLLLSWLGIPVGPSLSSLLSFAFFGLLLAAGVRLRRGTGHAQPPPAADPAAPVSFARIGVAFFAMPVALLVLVGGLEALVVAEPSGRRPAWHSALAFFAIPSFVMLAGFAWTHRFSASALRLFPFAALYALAAYIVPLASATKGAWQPTLDALLTTPPWVSGLLGIGHDGLLERALAVQSLAFVNLVVSLMLALAPAAALRRRLLASVAVSVLLLAANLLLLAASALHICLSSQGIVCRWPGWRGIW